MPFNSKDTARVKHHPGIAPCGNLVDKQVIITVMERQRTGKAFGLEKKRPAVTYVLANPTVRFPGQRF